MAAAEIAGLEPQNKPSFNKPNHRPGGGAKRNKPKFGQGRPGSNARFSPRSGSRSGSFQNANSKH
jgi:adenine specific DNA methylase Mod